MDLSVCLRSNPAPRHGPRTKPKRRAVCACVRGRRRNGGKHALEGGLGHVNVGRAHVNVDDGVNVGGVHVEMQIHQRGRRLTLTWARVNVDRRTTLTWACVNAGGAHACWHVWQADRCRRHSPWLRMTYDDTQHSTAMPLNQSVPKVNL